MPEKTLTKTDTKQEPMQKLFNETKPLPVVGDLVEGTVIIIEPGAVYVELMPFGTGIIYGREYINARDLLKNVNVGDTVTATVVDLENEDGYIELSLKEARQAIVWAEAEAAIAGKKMFDLEVTDANKGGLIMEWQGIQGFIPASQLKADNYPRVEGGDKEKILSELQKLVGKKLTVSIITADPKEGKLIFSEKDLEQKEQAEVINQYEVGDTVEGKITGVVDFGVFIEIEDGLEGLAHISELDWGLVEDPRKFFEVGETVKARVIEIKEGQISLSIKALKPNPWTEVENKYKPEQEVQAVVIKYNKHGALASVEEGVAGLVHISEFNTPEELRETLELGKTYPFKINLFDPKNQRLTLSYLGSRKSPLQKTEDERPKTEDKDEKTETEDKKVEEKETTEATISDAS